MQKPGIVQEPGREREKGRGQEPGRGPARGMIMAQGREGEWVWKVQYPRKVQESGSVRGHFYKSLEGDRSLGWFKSLQ